MKTPQIEKFKSIRYCNLHHEECKKVDKTKKDCGKCKGTEEVFQYRNT